VGNDFRFLSFLEGNNTTIEQTSEGVVISQRLVYDGVYIGFGPQTLTGQVTINPTVFSTPIPGSFNSGVYSLGTITVPSTGIYYLCCQFTVGSDVYTDAEFARVIELWVNGSLANIAYKTSFSSEYMTICMSLTQQYTAGDTLRIVSIFGGNALNPYTVTGYLSFRSE
jgi:hypothetical protein